jgi:DNA-binding CsgD family transcriptional regulator
MVDGRVPPVASARARREGPAGLKLRGRRREFELLDELVGAVRGGESRALVLRGEPGVGKTVLLRYAIESASDLRVARTVGVESEMELAYAALHQLCGPMLDRLEYLPEPQRAALAVAIGLSAGPAPDRFLVGLAVLGLLSEAAEEQPVICVIDDAQWLDRASVQALAFVARRLLAESVALVFATREPSLEFGRLPEMMIEGLSDADARELLESAITGPLDKSVRDRVIAETGGNPLALLELPRGLTPAQLAGGFGLADALPLSGRIEESFRRRLSVLPADTRRLLLVAAAEPAGEPVLVWRAAELLGIDAQAARHAKDVLELGAQVRFRHPLVRSAVYQAASPDQRRSAHRALAQATDPEIDPDRRAWHRSRAVSAPDEDVAAELERSAGRAQARGGVAAAAAFLEQASVLTLDPGQAARRALAAAWAKLQAGAPDAALRLLATAEAGPLDQFQRARVDLLRAQIAAASSRGRDAPPLLLKAARELERHDVALARDTHLELLAAVMFAGQLASGGGVSEAGDAARTAPPPSGGPRPPDLLLDGLALLLSDGHERGAPILKRALRAFREGGASREEELRWLWLACQTAMDLWDDESWRVLSTRFVELARDAGALAVLPIALSSKAGIHLYAGELDTAASLIEEMDAAAELAGIRFAPYAALGLAAVRGRETQAAELIDASLDDVAGRGEGVGIGCIAWTRSFLHNSFGRYEEALTAAEQTQEYPATLLYARWGLIELIEAGVRTGKPARAAEAVVRLSETTRPSGTDWALGIEARSHALLSEGDTADRLYREAIELLGRTQVRMELGRAHLVYGEWLRGEGRRRDARQQLRTAHGMFVHMANEALADRAARELLHAGGTARSTPVDTGGDLTAQEAQIARLARDGLSNPDIGSRLFISRRTVQYHLRKVYAKLEISSRDELAHVLGEEAEPSARERVVSVH